MHRPDFIALAPLLILALSAAAVMLAIALRRNHLSAMGLSLTGLGAALTALPLMARYTPRTVTPLLIMDHFALFYTGLILAATAVVIVLSYDYFSQKDDLPEEAYLLLLLAALGAVILVCARHVAALFLGLEILSVSLYALIAYTRDRNISIEAGIKYLVLAAVSAAFLLFGAALIYAHTGALDFQQLGALLKAEPSGRPALILLAGLGFLVVAVGFKLALTPFHMWTPDIYQGAPAPVTAFVATVSKGAMAALLVRLFTPTDLPHWPALYLFFTAMAAASMAAGNLLALLQTNVKRLLAYSSIAHMGYLLAALLFSGQKAAVVMTFYLTVYVVSILGCFGIIAILSSKERDADTCQDLQGLFFRRPLLTGVFTTMLLSLAGIPLTAGFIGKFYVVSAGVENAHWFLVIILVVFSGVGLFYYLRVIIAMFSPSLDEGLVPSPALPALSAPVVLTLTFLSTLVLWLGVWPSWFLATLEKMLG